MQPLFRSLLRKPLLALLPLMAGLLAACSGDDHLSHIKEEGVLRIVTRNGPTTYYEDRNGPAGFEYVLAKKFADRLGVELEVHVEYSIDGLFTALAKGRGDLAAAGLTITEERSQQLMFSIPYMDIEQRVLYRADRREPETPADLTDANIQVIASSSHAAELARLQQELPNLNWHGSRDVETVDLLDQLMDGEIDYTVIDSNEFIANRGFYPRIRQAFRIGEPGQHAWAVVRNDYNQSLLKEVNRFIADLEASGELGRLVERFYSHSEDNTQPGSRYFTRNVNRLLPQYRELIESAAQEYEMEWQLLAAISYQESHWNPRAVSPTGVRGFMMLTLTTAKEMGVTNRIHAEQSLRGGARYFKKIHQRLPESVREPDRTWFALAAYNIGTGHLEDARVIVDGQGGDPNKWADVKEVLPLLRKRKWYQHTNYGYARGDEAVTYVQNIRHYYNLLTWSDVASNRTPPPTDMEQYVPDDLKQTLKAL